MNTVASDDEITKLLAAMHQGDPQAEAGLVALVYDDFHAIARRYMTRERPGHTLQPTALVNEAYMRLLGDHPADWQCRSHFFAAASIVMRRILVDHAKSRGAAKRSGGRQRVDLDDFMAAANPRIEQLLILDQALDELAKWDRRQARVVEMIFFGGMTRLGGRRCHRNLRAHREARLARRPRLAPEPTRRDAGMTLA